MDYSIKNFNKEHMARAAGTSLPISTKKAVEICNFIRNKELSKAKKLLSEVVEKKRAIPFKRYNKDTAHKKKIGPGKFPEKASQEILKLLNQIEANAQFKGLNTSNLVISHICAHKASRPWHFGRKRRRRMKRTHIEIVVEEKSVKKEKIPKKTAKKDKK